MVSTSVGQVDTSTEEGWSVVTSDEGFGPWKTLRFHNGRGFEAEYRIDYRYMDRPFFEFPVDWVLRTLKNYDTWRDNEDR